MEKVHQLAVEDTIRQECKEQNVDDKFTCILQGICRFFNSPQVMVILVNIPNFLVSTLYTTLVKNCSMETWSVHQMTNLST